MYNQFVPDAECIREILTDAPRGPAKRRDLVVDAEVSSRASLPGSLE